MQYDSYKDSGEQWLGQIPSHWEIKRLGNFIRLFSEKGFPDAQLLSVTREQGVILRDKDNKEENHNFVPDDLSGYKHVHVGDFVINKMKAWQGSYGVSDYEGIVSPAYYTCSLQGVNKAFFSRAMRSKVYAAYFMRYSKGIRVDQWDLDSIALKSIPFAIPPLPEQERMVAYLDKETAAIDAAIAQQQKMIDLLNERKQIIIQQAVTKGLDPNAKMKDSGIDWIGQIPESWHTRLLKRICKIKTGRTPSTTNSKYFDGGINWYTPGDLNDFALQTSVRHVTEKAKTDQACEVYPARSVYLVGIGGTIGKVGYSEKESSCNQQINVIIPNEEIVFYKYLAYFLQLAKIDVLRNANLSTLPIISQNRMGEIYAVCPSLDEQKAIVKEIERHIKPIQTEQDHYNSLISLLRERKQIIINEVVTGKIKVQ